MWWHHISLVALDRGTELTTDTGMRAEKSKQHDYYKDQPTNEPPTIAKAIAALAADETNHGT